MGIIYDISQKKKMIVQIILLQALLLILPPRLWWLRCECSGCWTLRASLTQCDTASWLSNHSISHGGRENNTLSISSCALARHRCLPSMRTGQVAGGRPAPSESLSIRAERHPRGRGQHTPIVHASPPGTHARTHDKDTLTTGVLARNEWGTCDF